MFLDQKYTFSSYLTPPDRHIASNSETQFVYSSIFVTSPMIPLEEPSLLSDSAGCMGYTSKEL